MIKLQDNNITTALTVYKGKKALLQGIREQYNRINASALRFFKKNKYHIVFLSVEYLLILFFVSSFVFYYPLHLFSLIKLLSHGYLKSYVFTVLILTSFLNLSVIGKFFRHLFVLFFSLINACVLSFVIYFHGLTLNSLFLFLLACVFSFLIIIFALYGFSFNIKPYINGDKRRYIKYVSCYSLVSLLFVYVLYLNFSLIIEFLMLG